MLFDEFTVYRIYSIQNKERVMKTVRTQFTNGRYTKMKLKKKSKFAAMLLTAAVALSLTACQSKGNDETVNSAEFEAFKQCAKSISDINIPKNVRIVALGEATHGNNEFQKMKLSVFKQLVATTPVRAFALEGDMGGCAIINNYIQGGEGTAEDVVRYLGYRIYKTDNMVELIKWMREYNDEAENEDKVRLYGLDIQYTDYAVSFLNNYFEKVDAGNASQYASDIESYFGIEDCSYDPSKKDEIISFVDSMTAMMDSNRENYVTLEGEDNFDIARRVLQNLSNCVNYREGGYSGKFRDTCMKDNALWMLNIEETRHSSKLMMSTHNGHMTKNMSSTNTYLGYFLYEELGDDYYAIGTDFYNTLVNLPDGNQSRGNYEFCSDDKLALMVRDMPENEYYIDFKVARENETLASLINNPMPTGTLGESYSSAMKFAKAMYQINYAPADMYDSMILVYDATPIEIKY